MQTSARLIIGGVRRLHFFEIFPLLNLAVFALFAWETLPIAGSPLQIAVVAVTLVPNALAGIAVRSAVAALRGERGYFAIIRSGRWIAETARLIVFTAVMVFTYGWIKLTVPVLHPRTFDQQLWDLDRLLFFGMSPTVFFLDLFAGRVSLRAIDWTYANVFYVSSIVAFTYFFSEPSSRVRVAFANGNAALWLAGAWLYLLVPSLGPAYRFPEIWLAHDGVLRQTQTLQAVLMRNYQNVLRLVAGETPTRPVRLALGIGAFPSLHVAFQAYMFLWMRRLWTSGEVLFGIFALLILVGSMVTGWHYLVDALAGMVMAWLCFTLTWRASRMSRWMAIKTSR